MKEKLEKIREIGLEKIDATKTIQELEDVRKDLTGKKSELAEVMKNMGSLAPEDKKSVGMMTTEIKNVFQEKLASKEKEIIASMSVLDEPIDLTVPGKKVNAGALHPITQMRNDLNEAFLSLGFEVYTEDDISSEDTENKEGAERLCLKPHLTGGSVRYLLKHGAPARFVYPGKVFRNETTDARHERAFYQYEALIVDKDISFSSGMVMIQTILEKVFGRKINTRMREGFFPFTEPGYEIDMECLVCGGVGCKVCNHNGWIEVMPGGVIHPNVLKSAKLDPDEWTGFYINIGLDRLVMMRYGVDDVRLFHSSDLRFLKQFK